MTSIFLGNIKGPPGRGISSIQKTGTNGLTDLYTIYYNDNTTTTFSVTNGTNGEETQVLGTFSELTAFINEANDGDVIVLTKDYKNASESQINIIDKNIIIIGNGHIIDGNNMSRAFNIMSGSLGLNNVIIQNCSDTNGGAIYINDASLNITESTLNNNNANDGYGGAIMAINQSNIGITNSRFNNNISTKVNANSNGGAIYSNNSNINIIHSIFTYNQADEGGAIRITDNSEMVMIKNIFQNNIAIIKGGAISQSLLSSFEMKDCLFENNCVNNLTSSDNANIYSDEPQTVYNCRYLENTTENITNESYITDENLMAFMTELSNKITT